MGRWVLVGLVLWLGPAAVSAQETRDLNLRGDRFAPLTWDALTPEQRGMVNDLLAGTRTSLNGPFNTLLRSPEMGNLFQKAGEYVRFRTAVPQRLNEMAILMTARWWTAQYVWAAHRPIALAAGASGADAAGRGGRLRLRRRAA
jgi:4-carboxymuconolactone decarboxylase